MAVNQTSRGFRAVNKELWLLLSIFLLAALVNNVIASQQVVLGPGIGAGLRPNAVEKGPHRGGQ